MMSKELLRRLQTDPELKALQERHFELFGGYIPYNWDQFIGYDDYLQKIRQRIADKEAER